MKYRHFTALIFAIFVLTGCSYEPQFHVDCVVDADCAEGATCQEGICVLDDQTPGEDMGDPDDGEPALVVERVEIMPTSARLSVAEKVQFTATAFGDGDRVVPDAEFEWFIEDTDIATIDAEGLATGVEAGTTSVTVFAEGHEATAELTVLAPVASVRVTPATVQLKQGLSATFTATPRDGNGDQILGRAVTWASSDEEVVEVLEDGTITALAVGNVTITATVDETVGEATVTVIENRVQTVSIQPDESELVINRVRTVEAVIRDGADNVLDPRGRSFSWAMPNQTPASLTDVGIPHQRRVLGLQEGTTTLTVTVDGEAMDDLVLNVIRPPIASVAITPLGASVPVGSVRQLEVVVKDDRDDELTDRVATWSIDDDTIATVEPSTGMLRAHRPGTATVTVDVEGFLNTLEVEVEFLLAQVSTGASHSCGVTPDSVGLCWGSDAEGQLGNGPDPAADVPVIVTGAIAWQEIWAASDFSCGIDVNGDVYCWGKGGFTGSVDGTGSDLPELIAGGLTFSKLRAEFEHACGITMTDEVWCWGKNGSGRLGDGTNSDALSPVQVDFMPPGAPTGLAIGVEHTCVATDTPSVWCFGKGQSGALGNMSSGEQRTPEEVVANLLFAEVSAGDQFTCARLQNNEVYCWGTNSVGQLGIDDLATTSSDVPLELTGVSLSAIDLGTEHGCGLAAATGEVQCWGAGESFKLGNMNDSDYVPAPEPTSAMNLIGVAVSAGISHSCMITDGFRPYCWGENADGRSTVDAAAQVEEPILVWP